MAKMSWNEALRLDDSLASLIEFFVLPPITTELLAGGLSNRCWKLTDAQGRHYVWRPITTISTSFGVSRTNEYVLLHALEHYPFAPKPILLNQSGLLVEWLEGQVMIGQITPHELLTTLADVHRTQINDKPIQKFNLAEKVDLYWMQLENTAEETHLESLYKRFRQPPYVPNARRSLCHFDLGDYNLIRTEKGVGVIDWEYAAVGDPCMDIAMTCSVAGLSIEKSVEQYCKIRGIADEELWIRGALEWLPCTQMMAMLWYYLGFQLWGDESYLQSAREMKQTLIEQTLT